MSKAVMGKLETTKRWLGKSAQADLNIKPAQAALASAEKATIELASLKAKLSEAAKAKTTAMKNLDTAVDRIKTEKRLKAKEAKLQSKLATLTSNA